MREILFMYGSKEIGWKYYSCKEKALNRCLERDCNMCYWTHPIGNINKDKKESIAINELPFGMDYTKCNFDEFNKKIHNIIKNKSEENFPEDFSKTTYYWQLTFWDNNKVKMWRGANYEPYFLQEIKESFADYY